MNDEKPKPRFPAAWKHYPVVVAAISSLITVGNALLIQMDNEISQAWISAAVSILATLLIWLRERRKNLGLDTTEPQ